jgi:ubiquinol-cytochrome c reductase cytochrome c subunit
VRDRGSVLLVSMAAGCAVVALAWWCRPGATGPAFGATSGTADVGEIRQVFLRDCATCHGADGRGTDLGPDLRPAGTALIDFYVSSGRMPLTSPSQPVERRTPRYSPATTRALVDYVSALVSTDGPPIPHVDVAAGDLPLGGTLYRAQCAACHAWSGNGGALLHREAPSVHPATPIQVAEAVRSGPGNMPAFGDAALTDHQLQSLVRYVRYLDNPDNRGGAPLWHLGPLVEGAVAVFVGLGALLFVVRRIGTRT